MEGVSWFANKIFAALLVRIVISILKIRAIAECTFNKCDVVTFSLNRGNLFARIIIMP